MFSSSGFTVRDSGNVVVENRYPVTKSEKSFYFDNTSCPHFPQPVPLFLYPTIFHWFTTEVNYVLYVCTIYFPCAFLDNFLFYYFHTDVTLAMYFYQ